MGKDTSRKTEINDFIAVYLAQCLHQNQDPSRGAEVFLYHLWKFVDGAIVNDRTRALGVYFADTVHPRITKENLVDLFVQRPNCRDAIDIINDHRDNYELFVTLPAKTLRGKFQRAYVNKLNSPAAIAYCYSKFFSKVRNVTGDEKALSDILIRAYGDN